MADEVVAYFKIQPAGSNPFNTHGTIEVCGNEQFSLGRDMSCRYSWHDDATISREHLRIHCILYEQDPSSKVAPFVYATDLSANGTYLSKSNAKCAGSQGRGISMRKKGSFLLDHGDELQLSQTVTLVYQSYYAHKETVLTATQKREKDALSCRYLITGRLLGEGGYGKVLIGIDQDTQRQLACKMVNLENLYDRRADLRRTGSGQSSSSQAIDQLPARIQKCFREFDILKSLSHPNIVHVQKVFWSRSTIYMFQELVTGGDLFSYIEYRQGKISNIESAVIIRQVLKGVQYLHDHDVVHRDLKPDNILMTSLDNGARVVITDFGHARFLPTAKNQHDCAGNKLRRMFSVVGTAEYAAPEIYRANQAIPRAWGYSLGVDMWSIGSITAAVLTGELLFHCRRDDQFEEDAQRVTISRAAECNLSDLDDEYHPLWGAIALAPKNFIKRLLVLDEEDRMSATEALNHTWFTHPMMAADFEAQYERSVRNWRPRQKDEQLVESISSFETNFGLRKTSNSIHSDEVQSRLFPAGRAPIRVGLTSDDQHSSYRVLDHQLAGPPESFLYDDINVNHGASFDDIDEITESSERYNMLQKCGLSERQADVDTAPDRCSILQTKMQRDANQAAAGQLHRVSTSTRGRYFQRETVDLDDLDASFDIPRKVQDSGETAYVEDGRAKGGKTLRREETVQVRTTPFESSQASDGVDLWWRHRYPSTQHHYETQAGPIAGGEDDMVIQETPPEAMLKPGSTLRTDEDPFEHHHQHKADHEALFAQNPNKRKKVYGRKKLM